MTAFGNQSGILVPTPAGYIDSAYPNGADGSDVTPSWHMSGFPDLTKLQVGTAFSVDLQTSGFLTDPGFPNSELGFYNVTGNARQDGWTITGTVLSNNNVLASSGVFRLVALRNGISVLSTAVSYNISTSTTVVVDNIAPTIPTGITAVPGTAVGSVDIAWDQPCDIAPNGANASGSAHVDVYLDGTKATPPSPITTASNALPFPTSIALGGATAPVISQNMKQWLITDSGSTGLVGATAEQCVGTTFGQYAGAQVFTAFLDAYGAAGALTALSGIALHSTNVAGGIMAGIFLRPLSSGSPGLVILTRTTASAAMTTVSTTANDFNGATITACYVQIRRAADLSSLTFWYSLDGSAWVQIGGTVSIPMPSTIWYDLLFTTANSSVGATGSIEEVALTNAARQKVTVNIGNPQVNVQLLAVDNANNASALSATVVGVAKTVTTVPPGSPRIHPGHRFWLDNPYYPGNQQGEINAAAALIGNAANKFNGLAIIFTWADISDAALTGGKQTFNIFQTNLQDVLNRLYAVTSKKIYLTVKYWQGAFAPSYTVTTTGQSGSTLNITGASLPSGITQAVIGSTNYTVSSNTASSITLSTSPGTVPNGTTVYLGRAKANDGSMFPAWLISNGWVKTFIQPNGNAREQLDYDNAAVWTASREMVAGMASVINALDKDNRIDIVAFGDESVAATVDKVGNAICNGANYDSQLVTTLKYMKDQFPTRTVWVPFNYSAETPDSTAMQSMFTQLQNYSATGFGYGGPDSPTFGTHGSFTSWYTTFLNVITGVSGTLNDVRDTCLRIGNTEGPGLLGAGNGYASKPALTLQQGFDDIMTRKNIPVNGNIVAHSGLGCSVMHWDYQTYMYYKTTDIVSCVNTNNGYTTPLPPGNWDTTP